jgi:multiple sugar transport system substrate-binding protein
MGKGLAGRTLRLIQAVSLCALVLIGGCTRVPRRIIQPQAEANAGRMITIKVAAPSADPALDSLIAAFHAAYPNYRVQKVPLMAGAASPIDLLEKVRTGEVDVVPVGEIDEVDQLLEPLDPYMMKFRFDVKPLGPGLEALRLNGKLYGLPYAVLPQVIVFNKRLFESEGVPLPADGWTWDQFRETARSLARAEGAPPRSGFSAPATEWLAQAYIEALSGGPAYQADAAHVRDALQFFSTLVHTDRSIPPAVSRDWGSRDLSIEPSDDLEWGRTAMTLEGVASLSALRSAGTDWDVAPMPIVPGARASAVVTVRTFGIARQSSNKEAAWRFISTAAGQDGAAAVARGGMVPMYSSPAVEAAWFSRHPAPPAGTAALFRTTWRVKPTTLGSMAGYQRYVALNNALNRTLSGESSWESAYDWYLRELERIRVETKP